MTDEAFCDTFLTYGCDLNVEEGRCAGKKDESQTYCSLWDECKAISCGANDICFAVGQDYVN